jgi:hypothetical protein
MFFRQKKSGNHLYLQVVENHWEDGRSKQRVIATIGRWDQLRASGQLEGLLLSGAKFSESVMVLAAHREGQAPAVCTRRIGPALVFGRLWEELRIPQVMQRLLADRDFELPLERILFLTVLHRLMHSGSDRACVRHWMQDYQIDGTEDLALHQVYRAMGWLGERLPDDQQQGATPFAPRCVKDAFEEALFERRRDLFSTLDLMFFDTTSIYFEGEGGEELGQYGHSKDHRPDRKQMIVAAILDGQGRPLCCELWPGNVTDVTTLIPVVDRLRKRFRIGSICIVADRGMIRKGYRKYLRAEGPQFAIDEAKLRGEARFDGKWVLQTDLEEMSAEDAALTYKQLWTVEEMFRTAKTLLETRPIYHKGDDTIRGHVFCSFLALLLRKELQDRLAAQGDGFEWAELLGDLDALQITEVEAQGKRFLLRSDARGACTAAFRSAGVALPPTIQATPPEEAVFTTLVNCAWCHDRTSVAIKACQ